MSKCDKRTRAILTSGRDRGAAFRLQGFDGLDNFLHNPLDSSVPWDGLPLNLMGTEERPPLRDN